MLLSLSGCSFKDHTVVQTNRILFFGDSITELGVQPNGYVTLIRDSLVSMGNSTEVIGAGISGNKVPDLLSRIEQDVLEKHPSVVVIYIGINDVWHYAFAMRGLSGTPKDEYEKGLIEIIQRIHAVNGRTILCTPTVIGEKRNGDNSSDTMLDEYSAISRRVASETGSTLCDLRKIFIEYLTNHNTLNAEKDILTYDGVHLNDAGNRLVAASLLPLLTQ